MTHDEARELIGAVPGDASAELLAHLQTCPECQAYRDQMLALDAKLKRALELDWHQVQVASVLKRKEPSSVGRHTRPRLFAFAASVAAALLIGGVLWLSRPAATLAAEIVTHVQGEPNSWAKTEPLSSQQLDAVLRKSGVHLGAGMQPVVYASSCWFRGHFVPHVVVTTPDGPVTVMILLHERVSTAQQFNEDGYSGLLVPASTGSVAVLSRAPMNLEKPAANVVHALQTADSSTP